MKKIISTTTIIIFGLLLIGTYAHAIEVQVGNRAQTMGQAFTAVADDPSAVLHNPAGLTQIKNTEIDVGIGLHSVGLTYTDTNGVEHPSDELVPVPSLFASTDTLNPVVIGAGLYVPWGSRAEIDADAASGFAHMKSELVRYDFTLAAAYQFNDVLSAGVGFTTAYTKVSNDIDASGLFEDATGFGFSGIAGVLWKPHPRFKMGLNFRGPMQVGLDGSATVGGFDDNFTTDLNFPATTSLGLAVIPMDDLTVSFNFDWTHWSFFNQLVRDYDTLPSITQPVNGEDAHDYRIGFEYRRFEKTHLRWGYSYQQAGWPEETILPTELDHNLHVVAVGVSQFFWKMRLDLGYEFSTALRRETSANLNGFSGNYDGTRHIGLLTAAFMF